jgi:nitrite reductase (NO-forming)
MIKLLAYGAAVASLVLVSMIYVALVAGSGQAGEPGASAAPSGGAEPGEPIGEISINAFDLGFEPDTVDVPEPGTYTVHFMNDGAILHDITFEGQETQVADPGQMVTFEVVIPEGGTTFLCSVPGHADGGMTGAVTVAGEGGEGEGDGHGGPAPETGVEPDPNAPDYVHRPPEAPARLDGEVHDIELYIQEKPMTVAQGDDGGFAQAVWTFGTTPDNGTVPGPVIRVKVGDTIRVHLINPDTNQIGHSIDFHASQVAWNDEMTTINPGEEKVYEWVAEYAGVWMYHCGTNPALHHIANGMYGMVIVEPAEGLPPVDAEVAVVQSEWYLGPQGEPASLSKAAAGAPAPDFVVFNGVANQYVDNPIEVGTGERVRIFVLNAGPSIDSSFHVVGTIFSSVIKEGVRLDPGNAGNFGSQAVDLSPAQGAIIEMVMPEDGLYPMVTHAFNFVGRGALGLFQAGDGDPLN